ncbi:MAG: TonB-dependent receptor plug domain-containing protein [Pseudomonadota bacterium]
MKLWHIARTLLLVAQVAAAAEGAPPALAEVLVTARGIEEVPNHVPLAIDVVSGSQLSSAGVQNLDSLASHVPGLNFESLWGGINAALVIRGQSQPSSAGDNVGIFVDDVYQAGRATVDVAMLGFDRIEVIRGPQNTLFGRSTFAGAIHYVSQQPGTDPSLTIRAEAGSDSLDGLQLAGSGRMFGSSWLGRIALGHRQADGTHRTTLGGNLGDTKQQAASLSLVRESDEQDYRPVQLNIRSQQGSFGHPASSTLNSADYNCGARDASSGLWTYYCGAVPVARQFDLTADLPDSRASSTQISLRLERQLQGFALRSRSSFYSATSTAIRDFDGSAAGLASGVCTLNVNCIAATPATPLTRFASPNVISRPRQHTTDWNQELRLGHETGPGIHWMLGLAGYQTRQDDSNAFGADRGDLLPTERLTSLVASNLHRVGPLSPLNSALTDDSREQQLLQSETLGRKRNLAAFGMFEVPLVQASRARVELRVARDIQRLENIYANFLPSTDPDLPTVAFTEITPRFSIDRRLGDAWYGYASIARGARSGGINTQPGLDAGEQGFEPEYNWTSELALRYRGAAFIQALEATVYRIDWRNTQIVGVATSPGISTLVVGNTAGLITHGVETRLQLKMGSVWSSVFAFSWADPRFKTGSDDAGSRVFCGLAAQPPTSTFCAYGPPRTDSNGSLQRVPYLDDNQAARTPRISWNLSLRARPVSVAGDWQLGGEAAFGWQGNVFERPIDGAYYGARGLLSARVALGRGAWRAELWGSNLTNDSYVRAAASRGGPFYPSLPRPLDLLASEGRRIGLVLEWRLRDPLP